MQPLQKMIELDAIYRLKARYWRHFDMKEWNQWLDLFLEDSVLQADYVPIWEDEVPTLTLTGRKEIADFLVPRSELRKTVHHGHTPDITFQSENDATGIWAMEDILDYQDRTEHGHGYYYETYKKIEEEWKISTLHLRRLRLKTTVK